MEKLFIFQVIEYWSKSDVDILNGKIMSKLVLAVAIVDDVIVVAVVGCCG